MLDSVVCAETGSQPQPSPAVKRVVFAVLAPLGRMMGYKTIYPLHLARPVAPVLVAPLPEWVAVPDA